MQSFHPSESKRASNFWTQSGNEQTIPAIQTIPIPSHIFNIQKGMHLSMVFYFYTFAMNADRK